METEWLIYAVKCSLSPLSHESFRMHWCCSIMLPSAFPRRCVIAIPCHWHLLHVPLPLRWQTHMHVLRCDAYQNLRAISWAALPRPAQLAVSACAHYRRPQSQAPSLSRPIFVAQVHIPSPLRAIHSRRACPCKRPQQRVEVSSNVVQWPQPLVRVRPVLVLLSRVVLPLVRVRRVDPDLS